MKKQINPTTKAYLIRGAFYLLLLIAVCAIPFALAQRNTKRSMAQLKTGPVVTLRSQGEMPSDAVPSSAAARVADVPLRNSVAAFHPQRVLPPPKAPQLVLYDQYDNAATTSTLCAAFDDFTTSSSDLADDFVVPAGQTWNVESIDADGVYFMCPGDVCPGATDWNVFIYADNGGLPGTQVYSTTHQPVSVSGTTFTVNLTPAAVLTAGTYWIEIQPNMTFVTEGEWGWTDRTVQSNSPAAWQNPGGGFAICPAWTVKTTCLPTAGGPDQEFRLNGTIVGGSTPTPTPTATATPTGSPSCTPIVITGSIADPDPSQTDRLNRTGIPQTCPATTTCGIFSDGSTHRYDAYTFTNTTGSTQCVNIDTNTACTGVQNIFTAAYLGSFDPNNICNNWIGDAGFSPEPDQAFQVDVDAGQTIVVVVSEVNHSGCPGYTLTVTGLCGGFSPSPTPTGSPIATATPTATPSPTPTPTASPSCTPTVITGSIATGDPTQTDRLVRSGVPQTCPASTTCAIFGDLSPHRYDAYTFTNTTGATQCVNIDTNTECTGTQFIFIAAYLGSFDPANICNNWIGDAGLSPNPDQAFQVDVDDGQTIVVVVSEYNFSGCPSYTLTITGLCGGFTPSPTPTGTPIATATPTATPTASTTSTPRPTPTVRPVPSARPRPTPAPRPTP